VSALGRLRRARRREGGLSPVAAGALLIVTVVVASFLGFTKSIPFRRHFEVSAQFATSNNLRTGSPVRIAGVDVGRVVRVEPHGPRSRSALVTMRIQESGRPLRRDATAAIKPRIFLEGNFFVDLTSGTPSGEVLEEGETIPVTQTSTPVQLDQVLGALRGDTREDLRSTLADLAVANDAGLGRNWNRTLEYQPAAFLYSSLVNDALVGEGTHDLSDFIRDAGVVTAALDRSPRQLQALLRDFHLTASALAAEERSLRVAVHELPRALRVARPTLDALNLAFPDVRRLAREALPGVRTSGPTIDLLLPLVTQLRGLVSPSELLGLSEDLRATIPSLAALADKTVPLLEEVRAASSCQNEVILPWSRDRLTDRNFPARGPVYQEAVKWLPGISGESRSFDANGPWFKVLGGGGVETFQLGEGNFGTALFPFLGSNPPKPAGRSPLRPDVPCETQEPPNLDTKVGPPPQQINLSSNARTRERAARARRVAIDRLRARLLRSGSRLRVLDRDARDPGGGGG
jgi:virulence factor Mce-like protein